MPKKTEFIVEGLSGNYDSENQVFVPDEIGGVDVVEWPCGLLRFCNVPLDLARQAVSRADTIAFLQSKGYTLFEHGED